ncbi:hypothetical protein KNP414_05164 [Paenibacillus mucilaginosus KNP414]|uniref:Uncharacterized protein n=1 Tax=Paenibacillus mucilaginosus (strain KNP414) TaxID=1036673 RepID=F8F9J9_PAEMK|nr:hypothetical protein KNP414_05164 [Paenibacillus mucilaginosus KNP414]
MYSIGLHNSLSIISLKVGWNKFEAQPLLKFGSVRSHRNPSAPVLCLPLLEPVNGRKSPIWILSRKFILLPKPPPVKKNPARIRDPELPLPPQTVFGVRRLHTGIPALCRQTSSSAKVGCVPEKGTNRGGMFK